MKLISDQLLNDIQKVIDNAIHSKYTWSDIASVKRAISELEDAPEPGDKTMYVKEVKKK